MTAGFKEYLKQHWLGYAVVITGVSIFVLFFVGEYLQYREELINHIIELSFLHILVFLTLPLFAAVAYSVDRAVMLEREARKSEEKYRELFENAYDMIFTLDLKGNVTSANEAAYKISGYSAEDLPSLNITQLLPPDMLRLAMMRIARIAKGEIQPPYEYEIIKKDGSRAIIELSSRVILSAGKAVGIHCIARDITERKQMEEELRLKAQLLDATTDSVFLHDLDGNIIYVNEAACKIRGYSKEELMGMNLFAMVVPEYAKLIEPRKKELIEKGEATFETAHFCKDKSIIQLEAHASAIVSSGRRLILSINRDITERKRAEGELRDSEEKFRAIAEYSGVGITIVQDRKFIYVNPAVSQISGYTQDEMIGMHITSIIHPESHQSLEERRQKHLAGTTATTGELKVKMKTGEERWTDVSTTLCEYRGQPAFISTVVDITERKRTEEALIEAKTKYEDLYDNSPDLLTSVDAATAHVIRCNQSYVRATGYSREEVIGRSIFDLYHPDCLADARKAFQLFRETGVVRDVELKLKRKDGGCIDVSLNVTAVRDKTGKILYSRSSLRDITLRKLMEQKIAESERYLKNVVESCPDSIIALDTKGNIALFNDGAEKLFGYRREEAIGKNIVEDGRALFYGEVEKARRVMQVLRESKDGRSTNSEVLGKTRDGRDIYISFSASLLKNEKGEIIGTLGIAKDITQQKLAEEALRASEEQYRSLVESTEDSIYVVDRDCRYLFINNKHLSRIGFSMNQVRNKSYSEFHSIEETKEFAEKINNVFEAASSISYEHRSQRDSKYFLRTLNPIIIEGKVNAVTVISKDITERKQMEDALRESEASYRELADSITDIFFAMDKDLIYTYWNNASEILSGVLAKDAIGKSIFDIFPETKGTKIEKTYREVLKTQQPRIFETEFKRGVKQFFFEITVYPSESGLSVFAKDITERKHLEQELQSAYAELKEQYDRKMDFTNMAAHELRTPLVPIVGYLSMLKEVIQDEKLLRFIEIMERNAMRQSRLIDRMLELSRLDAGKVDLDYSDINVDEIVQWMLYDYFPTGREFLVDIPRNMVIRADEDKLFQILDNLISNAVKYSPADTAIKICIEERSRDYLIKVIDHGPGIAKEEQKRIFERFYIIGGQKTTRESKRTGLGLALAKSYVELHGGRIWLESEPGKGATFNFTIPKLFASG